MPEVSVNSKQIKNTFNSNSSIKDVANYILTNDSQKNNPIITEVYADGKKYVDIDERYLEVLKMGQIKKLQITVRSSVELAFEALDSANQYIDTIINKTYLLTESYQQNKLEQANNNFIDLIEVTDLFIQLMAKIHRNFKTNFYQEYTKPKSLQKLEIHLLSILKAMIPAKENNDIIMLCDLLEYELVDNLKMWKVKVIPVLKKMKG